jgi:hypothetical protein
MGAVRRLAVLLLAAPSASLLWPSGAALAAPVPPADTVLVNGGIYTVDARRSWAQAAALRNGRIVAVGSNAEIRAHQGPGTAVIDLTGRLALPGFHDSHVHVASAGLAEMQCPLYLLRPVEAILAAVAKCAQQAKNGWIIGDGWDLSLFESSNPRKELLDNVVPDRPVILIGGDGHSGWANSRALALAGITATTLDPPNGRIERDPKTGEPSGTLRETAMDLVMDKVPPATPETLRQGLKLGLQRANEAGITSFIEASADDAGLDTFKAVLASGELSAKVLLSLTYGTFGSADFEGLLSRAKSLTGPRLKANSIKIFVDGVLEGETAALLVPYLTIPTSRGSLNMPAADLTNAVIRFDAMGLQVHMHAIGDGAVRAGLDAVAAARARNGMSDGRHHIAHLQLVHPDDIPRFAALGVAANFQALWAYPDEYIMDLNLPQVGPERVNRMYPIASLRRTGARIVAGSDWSVSTINPWPAIQVALTRQHPDGTRKEVLNESERVDLATMIAAYTMEGAWLMRQEAETGSIEVGKAADILVLDRDVFRLPAAQIGRTLVDLTLVDGSVVYRRPDVRPEARPGAQ